MNRLEAIRKRAEAATVGPWYWVGPIDVDGKPGLSGIVTPDLDAEKGQRAIARMGWGSPVNVPFVTHAREDIPALLRVAEAAQVIAGAATWINPLYKGAPKYRQEQHREFDITIEDIEALREALAPLLEAAE